MSGDHPTVAVNLLLTHGASPRPLGRPHVSQQCAVPSCENEATVWTLSDVLLDNVPAEAMVPFCRAHGPLVGSDV